MPRTSRKYGVSVTIPEDAHATIVKISESLGIPMKECIATLIDMGDKFDLLRPEWQKKINAALKQGDRVLQRIEHTEDKNKCGGLREADNKWKCIIGRKKQTPMIRYLALNRNDALNLCEGCIITLEPVLKVEEQAQTIKDLEGKLETSSNVKFKIPKCNKGAILNDDATEFRNCPKASYKSVSVEKFCKVYTNGLPCMLYAESVIGVAAGKSSVGDML
ncbi:MAG: hypothetical protein ACXACY_22900 [Candidatus Hodarchaeales archaeon]|jgi:hypothetical protein